jgi:hypothetical protein
MPRKKLTPVQAKALLLADGMDFTQDFHALGSSDVQRLADVAKLAGYRKSKNAPGSTARMYYQYLSRVAPVARASGEFTPAERRGYQDRARKKKTPAQLDAEIAAVVGKKVSVRGVSVAVNGYGLTYQQWCYAAGLDSMGKATDAHYAAWKRGEDPSDWRAESQRGRS